MDWDAGTLIYIQEHFRSDVLTPFVKFITHTGDSGLIWIILCIALVLIPKTRKLGIIAGSSIALEAIITNLIIKNAVARTRPYEAIEGLINLIEKQKDYSFPSGHSGASFAVAGALLVVAFLGIPVAAKTGKMSREKTTKAYKILAIISLIYATVIALSRLYVGVHYPTDVIAGILLGLATSVIAYFGYHFVIRKWAERKATEKD